MSLTTHDFAALHEISSRGTLDWAISGANEKAGGTAIHTSGSGTSTLLISASGGGTSQEDAVHHPSFSYTDGVSPLSSSGQRAFYQYDKPAVDITLPKGTGRITAWFGVGWITDPWYNATFASGTTTGNVFSDELDPNAPYELVLDYATDSTQVFTFRVDHEGDWSGSNNVGLYAVAVDSQVPEPSALVAWSSLGVVGAVVAYRRRRRKVA